MEMEKETGKIDWATVNTKELACPKCGVIGSLWRQGKDFRRHHYRYICRACGKTSSDLQLKLKPEATLSPANTLKADSSILAILQPLLDRMDRFEKLLGERQPVRATANFSMDDYTMEQQAKINALIGLMKDNPSYGLIRLQKALKDRLGSGLSKSDIVKVRNAYKRGYFGDV